MLLGATFCADTANIWHLVGLVVYILKIVIPLVLIVLGMVDLGKAVVSSDEKAINKAVGSLIKRFIAAVVVFFIPTIVNAVFGLVGVMSGEEHSDYTTCVSCLTDPNNEANCDYRNAAANLMGNDE